MYLIFKFYFFRLSHIKIKRHSPSTMEKCRSRAIKWLVVRLDSWLDSYGYSVVKQTSCMNKGCQVEFELEEVQEKMEVEKLEKKQSETLQHAAWKHEQQSQCGVKICGMDETPKELRLSFKDIVLSKLADLNMNTPAIEK